MVHAAEGKASWMRLSERLGEVQRRTPYKRPSLNHRTYLVIGRGSDDGTGNMVVLMRVYTPVSQPISFDKRPVLFLSPVTKSVQQPLVRYKLAAWCVQLRKLKESKKQAMLKEMVGRDLRKRRRCIMSRVKDFQQLYDLVKNQRNRFVNLIQAARQGIAEMKEKLRISSNELEILRSESSKKDHLLVQRRADTQKGISFRNSMRAKLNAVRIQMRVKQDRVDEQIAEIDKHNSIINTAERDMIRLRKQYEVRTSVEIGSVEQFMLCFHWGFCSIESNMS